jgi:outer membrane protein OmpA-like peptidoglycan-associated protein
MTDMTVSFLFIIMVLLAFFASQLRDPRSVPRKEFDTVVQERNALREQLKRLKERPIEAYLAAVANQRQQILKDLQAKLKTDFPDLQVVISDEMDALRFKGDGLFKTGSSELNPDKRRIVESIATRLGEVLPCYTLGPRASWSKRCNAAGAVIEAVLIEGHTDSDGQDNSNVTLSTNRANETFFAMTKHEPTLVEHLNDRAQPVLSVAGYGKMRPVADNGTPEGKATNRRIDLRIIMYTPGSVEDIRKVQDDLRKGVTGAGAR